MATETKTPLQAVVSVICDVLCELPPDDQARAVEAVCLTLGLRPPRLPAVQVEMMSGRPIVTSPSVERPDRALVAVGGGGQLSRRFRAREISNPANVTHGYVRPLR